MKIAVLIPTMFDNKNELLRLLDSLNKTVKNKAMIDLYIWINDCPDEKSGRSRQELLADSYRLDRNKIVHTHRNCGYTGSLNKLFELAGSSGGYHWYLTINDDAAVDPGFYSQLLNVTADAWSPAVRDAKGKLESIGLTYSRSGLSFPATAPYAGEVNRMLCGTCLALSGKTVQSLNERYGYIFQPLFFAYAEDVELSLRLKKLGLNYKISNTPLVTHWKSTTLKRGSEKQLYFGFRNLIMTAIIHWKFSEFVFRLPWALTGLGYMTALSFYKGYFLLPFKVIGAIFKRLPLLMRHRKEVS
jgi:GT2 family glycosyltransferase